MTKEDRSPKTEERRPRICKLKRTRVRPCICKLNRKRVRPHTLQGGRRPEVLCKLSHETHGLARFRPRTLQPEVTCTLNRRTFKSTRVRPHAFQPEVICKLNHLIQTACTPPSLTTQRPEEDGLTALPSLQLKPTYTPDDDSARPAGHAVARRQEEEMAVEKEFSALQLEDTVNRFLPEQRMHDFHHKPET